MLLIVIALLWGALLIPLAVRRLRDHRSDRSIEQFHAEHEVLSRQEHTRAPAHRLDEPDEGYDAYESDERPTQSRPRLTVVHADDTYQSLENRGSWDEWNHDYDFDEGRGPRRDVSGNRYAAAYASVPRTSVRQTDASSMRRDDVLSYEAPRRRSMRARRRVVFSRLVLGTVVTSLLAFLTGVALLTDLAVLAWMGVVSFVSLALYAVSQGYLHESSLGIRLGRSRQLASVEPLYRAPVDEYADEYRDDEYRRSGPEAQWRDDSPSRYALG